MQDLRPQPDLLSHSLHFYKIPMWLQTQYGLAKTNLSGHQNNYMQISCIRKLRVTYTSNSANDLDWLTCHILFIFMTYFSLLSFKYLKSQ